MPEGPWVRQVVLGDSGLGPRAHSVDQLSRVTGALDRGPTLSTSCPTRLGTGSEGLRGQQALAGNSGPVPRACVVDQLSWGTQANTRGPAELTSSPACLGAEFRAHGVDLLSRDLGPESEGPWV